MKMLTSRTYGTRALLCAALISAFLSGPVAQTATAAIDESQWNEQDSQPANEEPGGWMQNDPDSLPGMDENMALPQYEELPWLEEGQQPRGEEYELPELPEQPGEREN